MGLHDGPDKDNEKGYCQLLPELRQPRRADRRDPRHCRRGQGRYARAEAIDEKVIEKHLYRDLPPVDLMIRTSGEGAASLSNFLLWQCAYAEFYFTDTLSPRFYQGVL